MCVFQTKLHFPERREMIKIKDGIFIREDELVFKFSRSAGPGGQNVNKLNTRVTVFFDVAGCKRLSGDQKNRILKYLATRASKSGVVRVVSQRFRTQKANRTVAIERLSQLLQKALQQKKIRKKTKVPFQARQRRLEDKKRRSVLKKQRAKSHLLED